jgi:HK97 family phage major capsid protein
MSEKKKEAVETPKPEVTSVVEVVQKDLKELAEKHAASVGELKEYVNKHVEEVKNTGKADDETLKAIASLRDEVKEIQVEMTRPRPAGDPEEQKSLTDHVLESDAWKDIVEKHKRGVRGSNRVEFKGSGLFDLEQKTTITSATVGSSTPGILVPERVTGIIPAARRRLRIRDLLPRGTTTMSAVEYPQENAFTSAKAESALTFTLSSATVRTIAHWIPATRQVLDDWSQLQRYIETTLLYGLKLKEETELLSGDGLGSHISGLTTNATAYAGTYVAASDTQLDTLRHANLELEVANEEPSGFVLNPVNLHTIELIKDEAGGANTGRYVVGDPKAGTALTTLWGNGVVSSNSIASGSFLAGNFQMAQIFDRMEAAIDISTEHASYFTSNMIALRAEERLALAIYRTGAFRFGTF